MTIAFDKQDSSAMFVMVVAVLVSLTQTATIPTTTNNNTYNFTYLSTTEDIAISGTNTTKNNFNVTISATQNHENTNITATVDSSIPTSSISTTTPSTNAIINNDTNKTRTAYSDQSVTPNPTTTVTNIATNRVTNAPKDPASATTTISTINSYNKYYKNSEMTTATNAHMDPASTNISDDSSVATTNITSINLTLTPIPQKVTTTTTTPTTTTINKSPISKTIDTATTITTITPTPNTITTTTTINKYPATKTINTAATITTTTTTNNNNNNKNNNGSSSSSSSSNNYNYQNSTTTTASNALKDPSALKTKDLARPETDAEDVRCNTTLEDHGIEWTDGPFSCRGRCGALRDFPCSCDSLCTFYGHCCHDFKVQCPNVEVHLPKANISVDGKAATFDNDTYALSGLNADYTDADADGDKIVAEDDEGEQSRLSIPLAECTKVHARLIAACPRTSGRSGPGVGSVEAKCQMGDYTSVSSVANVLPVTDLSTGLQYKNVHCLLCNGGRAENSLAWQLRVDPHRHFLTSMVESVDELLEYVQLNSTRLYALPQQGIHRFCIPDGLVKEFPSRPCQCPTLKRLCYEGHENVLLVKMLLFRNQYCVLCFLAFSTLPSRAVKVPTVQDITDLIKFLPLSILVAVNGADHQRPTTGADILQMDTPSSEYYLSLETDTIFPWTRMKCHSKEKVTKDPDSNSSTLTDLSDHPGLNGEFGREQIGPVTQETQRTDSSSQTSTITPMTTTSPTDPAWIHRSSLVANPSSIPSLWASNSFKNDGFSCVQLACKEQTFHFMGHCLIQNIGVHVVVSYQRDDRFARSLQSGTLGTNVVQRLSTNLWQTLENVHFRNFTVLTIHSVHNERHRMINYTIHAKDNNPGQDSILAPVRQAVQNTVTETLVNLSAHASQLETCIGLFKGEAKGLLFPDCDILVPCDDCFAAAGNSNDLTGELGVLWAVLGVYILLRCI